jgi:prephenate dehydratase
MNPLKIAIQGYPGSFHSIAASRYWDGQNLDLVPADTFDILGEMVASGDVDFGLMAIENSIAGTILQNYRIMRESNLSILGEQYLRIKHNLITLPGTSINQIKTVISHPMAIYQCTDFLYQYPQWKVISMEDTALAAQKIKEQGKKSKACIASVEAAELNGLEILAKSIESNKMNYTRFFVVGNTTQSSYTDADKASIYIRIPDKKGQLLQVLKAIDMCDINMSKLQSFPVLGSFREYYFHLDLEFDEIEKYIKLKKSLYDLTGEVQELGLYKRADITTIIEKKPLQNV